jgi:endonuclease III
VPKVAGQRLSVAEFDRIDRKLFRRICRSLERHYGQRQFKARGDALSGLVWTVLTQNTTDLTADRAYKRMRKEFSNWKKVLAAPAADVEACLRVCGLQQQKTRTIQVFLHRLQDERGSLSLAFLKKMPPQAASDWLVLSPGIGIKTAAVVLLFRLGHPLMAVDTHIRRVCWRVGLVPEKATAVKVQKLLLPILPETAAACSQIHLDLIWLGRDICHARAPECPACPLRGICCFGTKQHK